MFIEGSYLRDMQTNTMSVKRNLEIALHLLKLFATVGVGSFNQKFMSTHYGIVPNVTSNIKQIYEFMQIN